PNDRSGGKSTHRPARPVRADDVDVQGVRVRRLNAGSNTPRGAPHDAPPSVLQIVVRLAGVYVSPQLRLVGRTQHRHRHVHRGTTLVLGNIDGHTYRQPRIGHDVLSHGGISRCSENQRPRPHREVVTVRVVNLGPQIINKTITHVFD